MMSEVTDPKSELAHPGSEVRNTGKGGDLLGKKYRSYVFTYNNYSAEGEAQLAHFFRQNHWKFRYGHETAPTTGTPHLQGVCRAPHQVSWRELCKRFPCAHWEPCTNWCASWKNYCSKGDDIVTSVPEQLFDPEEWEESTFRLTGPEMFWPWQTALRELLGRPPNSRDIHWIYDRVGDSGKSAFVLYCVKNFPNVYEISAEKVGDFYIHAEPDAKAYFIDLPRDWEDKSCIYRPIENLKNNKWADNKCVGHDNKRVCRKWKKPHLVVMANWEPEYSKLSADRWKVYEVVNRELVHRRG